MENFIVGIPSYKRAEKQGTLDYLVKVGVPKERIYIFVQTASDRKAYSRYEDRANVVLKPAGGISEARNNVLNALSQRANVLMMDDDVSAISRMTGPKGLRAITDRDELAKTINTCFSMARKAGAQLMGLYPVHNAFFMDRSISTRATVNTVIGFPKGTKLRFDETCEAKEDVDLCGRILADGGEIYRYNFLGINAKHRTNAGGCNDLWENGANHRAVAYLCEKYPDVFAPNSNKPNEVRTITKDRKINLGTGSK